MKIVKPIYYKDFKCIADKCSDTCCAGWDVDVDEQSYEFYKKQKGEIGERLENVMVPKEEGGCTFTLTENMRCYEEPENAGEALLKISVIYTRHLERVLYVKPVMSFLDLKMNTVQQEK